MTQSLTFALQVYFSYTKSNIHYFFPLFYNSFEKEIHVKLELKIFISDKAKAGELNMKI